MKNETAIHHSATGINRDLAPAAAARFLAAGECVELCNWNSFLS
jgi:hypothetical protein